MDYQYTFRQAHQDRLEDAGIIQYRPADGFRILGRQPRTQRHTTRNRQRLSFATALLNIISK
jgi:hypothetical protein